MRALGDQTYALSGDKTKLLPYMRKAIGSLDFLHIINIGENMAPGSTNEVLYLQRGTNRKISLSRNVRCDSLFWVAEHSKNVRWHR